MFAHIPELERAQGCPSCGGDHGCMGWSRDEGCRFAGAVARRPMWCRNWVASHLPRLNKCVDNHKCQRSMYGAGFTLHTPRHCLDTKHIICPRSVYRCKNSKKQHCTKAMIASLTHIVCRRSGKKCRKTARSLHRPKAMLATLTYMHHVTAWTFGSSFVPDPYIEKKKRQKAALHHSNDCDVDAHRLSQLRISTKKPHVHCIAPKEWLPHSLTYNSALTGNTSWMQRPNATPRWSEHTRSFFDSASRLAVRRDTQETQWNLNGCSQDKHPDDRMQPPNATNKCNEEMSHRRLLVDHGDSTSNVEKLLRGQQFFNILTSWFAFRHSGVQFFNIRTYKSAPNGACLEHFHVQMCFSPQLRAFFRHLNFKKWSKHVMFCTFSLPNVLFATAACIFATSELQKVLRAPHVLYICTSKCAFRHSGVQFLMSPLSTYLRTRRFNRPTFRLTRHTNHWKNTAFRDFSNIWRGCIFFLLTFPLLHLLSADLTTLLCFSTVHIVGSFYLNFLRIDLVL